jgi:hypothetical protein
MSSFARVNDELSYWSGAKCVAAGGKLRKGTKKKRVTFPITGLQDRPENENDRVISSMSVSHLFVLTITHVPKKFRSLPFSAKLN